MYGPTIAVIKPEDDDTDNYPYVGDDSDESDSLDDGNGNADVNADAKEEAELKKEARNNVVPICLVTSLVAVILFIAGFLSLREQRGAGLRAKIKALIAGMVKGITTFWARFRVKGGYGERQNFAQRTRGTYNQENGIPLQRLQLRGAKEEVKL